MAGRYSLRPEVTSIDVLVSILARLNGRALPEANPARPAEQVKFQSSPGLMAGRYPELVSWYSAGDVQSSPGLMAGRYRDISAASVKAAIVSILARLNGRALRAGENRKEEEIQCFNPRPA